MTSRCEACQEDLKAYADGELSLVRRLAVRTHLARCAACREEMIFMEQISNEVRSGESGATASGTLDPALRAKILTNIAAEVAPAAASDAPPAQPILTRPRWRPQLAEYGAFATLVVVFGVGIMTFMGNKLNNTFQTASNAVGKGSADDYAQQDSALTPNGQVPSPAYEAPVSAGAAPAPSSASDPMAAYLGQAKATKSRDANNAVEQRAKLSESQAVDAVRGQLAPSAGAFKRVSPRPNYNGSTAAAPLPSSLRRVHKEARLTVEVEKIEQQSDAVESMVKSAGGFVISNTLSTGGNGLKTAALEIKVPVKQFENVRGQIEKLGEVKDKNVSGQDLTEQVSDAQAADNVLSSELSVKEAMLREARLKAAKKKDFVLNDWQQRAEVRRLRIEAAQMRARLELLRRTSDLSNISVQLQEKPHIAGQGGFMDSIGETGRTASASFLVAAQLPINLLIWILAYSPLWIPLLIAYHYATRVYGRRTPP